MVGAINIVTRAAATREAATSLAPVARGDRASAGVARLFRSGHFQECRTYPDVFGKVLFLYDSRVWYFWCGQWSVDVLQACAPATRVQAMCGGCHHAQHLLKEAAAPSEVALDVSAFRPGLAILNEGSRARTLRCLHSEDPAELVWAPLRDAAAADAHPVAARTCMLHTRAVVLSVWGCICQRC